MGGLRLEMELIQDCWLGGRIGRPGYCRLGWQGYSTLDKVRQYRHQLENEARAHRDQIMTAFKKENPDSKWYVALLIFSTIHLTVENRIPRVTAHYPDVSDPDFVGRRISEILRQHSNIDGLITSAGFAGSLDAVKYPIEGMKTMGCQRRWYRYVCHSRCKALDGTASKWEPSTGAVVNVPQPQA